MTALLPYSKNNSKLNLTDVPLDKTLVFDSPTSKKTQAVYVAAKNSNFHLPGYRFASRHLDDYVSRHRRNGPLKLGPPIPGYRYAARHLDESSDEEEEIPPPVPSQEPMEPFQFLQSLVERGIYVDCDFDIFATKAVPLASDGGGLTSLHPIFLKVLASRGVLIAFNSNHARDAAVSYAFFEALPPGKYCLETTSKEQFNPLNAEIYDQLSQIDEGPVIFILIEWDIKKWELDSMPIWYGSPHAVPFCQIYRYHPNGEEDSIFLPHHHEKHFESLKRIHRALELPPPVEQ